MTNTIYVRPVYVDEDSVEGSETQSAAGDDQNGTVEESMIDFLSITRMNCFAARSTSTKEEENDQNNNEDHEALLTSRSPNPNIIRNIPNHLIGEQVAAGWPTWICNNASEAIKGWTPRRARSFVEYHMCEHADQWDCETWHREDPLMVLSKQKDILTGNFVTIKEVQINSSDPESSMRSIAEEILTLRRLYHPNVIKLEGLVISEKPLSFSLVFEHVEYDWADSFVLRMNFSKPQVVCYMQQLLSGLEHCHSRGIFHYDINRSNILSNNGILKIVGFGSVSKITPKYSSTFLDPVLRQPWPIASRYRAPELLVHGPTDIDGVGVDLWSAGCVLVELLAGEPSIPTCSQEEELNKIFKLCGSPSEEYWRNSKPLVNRFKPQYPLRRCIAKTFKGFPLSSLPLIETLIAINPAERQTATAALRSKFLTSERYVCKRLMLPKSRPFPDAS